MRHYTSLLHGIWGSSATDVFAVGVGGTILHYDGNTWNTIASTTTGNLCGVWGSSGSDVFAVGEQEGSGDAIFSADDGHLSAEHYIILHYDGSAWRPMSNSTSSPKGVWGSSASDVFVVGYPGISVQDHSGWRPMEVPIGTRTAYFSSVWGSSSSDVFAVGNSGTILHYDGSTWSAMTSGTTSFLSGVWGSSATDVFAVGDGGTILHYGG
jgi:hypothetical protein